MLLDGEVFMQFRSSKFIELIMGSIVILLVISFLASLLVLSVQEYLPR